MISAAALSLFVQVIALTVAPAGPATIIAQLPTGAAPVITSLPRLPRLCSVYAGVDIMLYD